MKLNFYSHKTLRNILLIAILLSCSLLGTAQISNTHFYRIVDADTKSYYLQPAATNTVNQYLTTFDKNSAAAEDIWAVTSVSANLYTIRNFNSGRELILPATEYTQGSAILNYFGQDETLLQLVDVKNIKPGDFSRFHINTNLIYPDHEALTSDQYSMTPKGYSHVGGTLSDGLIVMGVDHGNPNNPLQVIYASRWSLVEVECKAPSIGLSSFSGTTANIMILSGESLYDNSHIEMRYSIGSPATVSSDLVPSNGVVNVTDADGKTVYAIAIIKGADDYKIVSGQATFTISLVNPTFLIEKASDIENMAGSYELSNNFDIDETIGTSSNPFTGTIDGMLRPTGTKHTDYPLVGYANGATIKNVIISKAQITSGNAQHDVGAICCKAYGASRIYNCGVLEGSIGDDHYVGGLVGLLDGTSRVINCYSYATINGGANSTVAGIVGYNNGTTTATSINTMVMNCMFYGDITGGKTVSPVYGGNNINNLNSGGLNTFNFYSYEALQTKPISKDKYNCALAVEEKYLNRFEFYRLLLNSNKKLAAIYASSTISSNDVKPEDMAKWVLETADRTIANPKPYPVLKAQGYYPSIINLDAQHAEQLTLVNGQPSEQDRNKGGKIGTLSVTISAASNWTNKPSNATLIDQNGDEITTSRTIFLPRTDKDADRFNYNYDKIQLPYYNDYGTKNYTDGKVVTGWKITQITNGTPGTYTAADQWNGYNFADRNCTNKDKYGTNGSNRVFSQGAYYDVPYGVTAITIEPYWGNAAFLADQYYDVVYNTGYSGQNVTQLGTQVTNSTMFNGKAVKYTVKDALATISNPGSTVYDNAIVLVGNFHQNVIKNTEPFNKTTAFTLMSVDLENDHEPDYSLIYNDNDRSNICPVRFDFLNVPGTAQAQKPNGTSTIRNASVFNPTSWFEITNTSLIYFSQFEYENNTNKTQPAPIILQGGVYDQFVSTKVSEPKSTTYIHVGGNAWFKDFGNGTHSDGNLKTKHVPVSVTGGDFNGFYLTGTYNSNAAVSADNAECYISGGHFKEAAGAGLEQINGNVQWQIFNADIENFYGGGINDAKPILGTITTDIYNSHVGVYCGGPKFGNMASGKKVTTNAEGSTFNRYFGAGYGGNSISRKKYFDSNKNVNWSTLQNNYINDKGKFFDGATTGLGPDNNHLGQYGYKGFGVAVDFDYEFFVWTSGTTGGRFFVKFATFSLAQCNDVESTLTNCTINENYYGGGNLGKVSGTATSVLDNCIVTGNVFGAGYSATLPPIPVRFSGFTVNPNFNNASGMFEPGEFSESSDYQWKQKESYPSNGSDGFLDNNGNYDSNGTNVVTTVDITKANLGSVGTAILKLKGNTTVGGNVYGGGDESTVNGTGEKGNTTVTLEGNTNVLGNVYGGGNRGAVGGNSEVKILDSSTKNK